EIEQVPAVDANPPGVGGIDRAQAAHEVVFRTRGAGLRETLQQVGTHGGGERLRVQASASTISACTVRGGAADSSSSTGIAWMPSRSNRRRSDSTSRLPVVSSFSPWKIEFAPARKHNACNSS